MKNKSDADYRPFPFANLLETERLVATGDLESLRRELLLGNQAQHLFHFKLLVAKTMADSGIWPDAERICIELLNDICTVDRVSAYRLQIEVWEKWGRDEAKKTS